MSEKIKVGDTIEVTITGIKEYGAFAKFEDEYNGLIHISQISYAFVKNINDYVKIGEKVLVKVLEINEKEKQLKLSLKALYKPIDDYNNGFTCLKQNLNIWINEKLSEINSNT